MNAEPKFAVGDIVALAIDAAIFRAGRRLKRGRFSTSPGIREPVPFQIITRIIEECSGGVQIMYRVTSEKQPTLRNELELVPYEEALDEAIALSEIRSKETRE